MPITYGSACSGIEAATQAWHPLGMNAAWLAEIEPFPSAVLTHHYPDVPNHGDMTKLAALVLARKIPAPDILVGGTPCQAFSVAGMREGLADPRGALTIKYVELADAIDHVRAIDRQPPAIDVWENVPGVLSDKGNAFGCFLGALAGEDSELFAPGKRWADAGCVYGPKRTIAWRILDAQYFGLAQRRRRVFVVASARARSDPTEVLFEREGVRRDTTPRRGEGQDSPAGTLRSTDGGSVAGNAIAGHLQPLALGGGANCEQTEVATALSAHPGGTRMDAETETFVVTAPLTTNQYGDHESRESLLVVHGTQDPCVSDKLAFALGRNNGQENAVCVTGDITHTLKAEGRDASEDGTGRGQPIVACREVAQTLTSNYGKQIDNTNSSLGPNVVSEVSAVRRLTPRECERLQGFPDDYTLIPWRGKPAKDCPDGPRYKAIGNSKAVPVVRWIGQRILKQITPSPYG
ncbi:DNA cytosine methyltransferase [Pseudomonas sp. P97.38]|uniref:DNA cytosine methyltransferase n=1 Tax=Pseudomonas sp. P97.38 TaxID=255451 RepID=UPI00069EBC5F|nr:DNA cytosine methyltransferase [Pseudomonas sp. P97.38]